MEQHEYYKYRGPGLREMNLDEYVSLVSIVRKRNDADIDNKKDENQSDEPIHDPPDS